MRRAVVVSVGVHAGLLAALAAWAIGREVPLLLPQGTTPAPVVELAPPAAIEIAIVTLPDEPASTGGGDIVSALPVARGAANIVAAASTGGTTSSEPATEPTPSTDSMRMRGRRHDLTLGSGTLDRILAPGNEGKEPYVAATDARLLPKSGKHEIRDAVTTVTVARDGTVRFKDKPDFKIRFLIPFGRIDFEDLKRRAAKEFNEWVADPYRDQRPTPTDEIPRACMMHDDVCYDGPSDSEGGGLIGGKADITAALHRKFIGDPYASRKLKLLDTTREARVVIGAQFRGEQLDRSSELAQRNIDALWKATRDPGERRAALFTLWDECAEGEGPAGQAGERARAIVMGWIRGRLPAGSPGAFGADEIARLDAARTSRQHFAPY